LFNSAGANPLPALFFVSVSEIDMRFIRGLKAAGVPALCD